MPLVAASLRLVFDVAVGNVNGDLADFAILIEVTIVAVPITAVPVVFLLARVAEL